MSEGQSVFTCEFCNDGLAVEEILFEGNTEWWCSDCADRHSIDIGAVIVPERKK